MAAQASKPMLTSAQAALKIWKHEPAAADSPHPASGPDGIHARLPQITRRWPAVRHPAGHRARIGHSRLPLPAASRAAPLKT
jgi:hypothetical protein